ncbi:hypothetical protein A9762_01730 [Pandoraea sp. ISTKB]|nr:hypothetical protein A9762_01730 [Pandoraea sp. ISTKB]
MDFLNVVSKTETRHESPESVPNGISARQCWDDDPDGNQLDIRRPSEGPKDWPPEADDSWARWNDEPDEELPSVGPQDSPPKVEDAWPRWDNNPRSGDWDLVLASENRSNAWSSLVAIVEDTLNMDPHYALALDVRSMEPTSNRLLAWERLLSDVCCASAAAARKVWTESPPPGFFDSGDVAQALALLEAAEARPNG